MMLVGNKTIIRAMNLDDIELLLKWKEDPEISFLLGRELPISIENQKIWYEKTINDNKKRKFIIETENGKIIGLIGIMNIDLKNRHCECGITIGEKEYWGKGLAKEALNVLIKFLFVEWNMNRIYAKINDYNEKSINLFQSLGFQVDGKMKDFIFTENKFYDLIILSLKRRD